MRTARLGRSRRDEDVHAHERRQRSVRRLRRTGRSSSRSRRTRTATSRRREGSTSRAPSSRTSTTARASRVEVEPGTYTVTENLDGRPFWDLISIACDDDDSTGDAPDAHGDLRGRSQARPSSAPSSNEKRSFLVVQQGDEPAGTGGDQSFAFDTSYGDFSLIGGRGERHRPAPPGQLLDRGDHSRRLGARVGRLRQRRRAGGVDLPDDSTVICTFTNRLVPEPGRSSSRSRRIPQATRPSSSSSSATARSLRRAGGHRDSSVSRLKHPVD